MKITAIETHVCHARMRNWVFVKVLTDQPGLYGWGEATLEWHTRAVVGAVEDLAELIVGEDPRRIEHVWQMMYRQHFWHGHGVVRVDRDRGNRHCPLGHRGQDRRRALLAALGRPRARLDSHLLPSGRRQAGRFLRNQRGGVAAICRVGATSRRRRLYGLQDHGRAADDAARRSQTDSRRGKLRGGDARCGGRGDRYHGGLPCPSVAGDGHEVRPGVGAVRALLFGGALLAGKPRWTGGDQSGDHDSHRDGRAFDASRGFSRPVRRTIAARSHSSISRIAAALPKPVASPHWPTRIGSRWRRTIRKARSAPPHRWSSVFRNPVTSFAKRFTTMSLGGRMS